MIHMLMRDPEEVFGAFLFKNSTDGDGIYFEYAYEDNDKRSSRVIVGKNILANEGRTRIRTNWEAPFSPSMYVLLEDDNMYFVEAVDRAISSVASQALTVNKSPERDTVLTLRMVRNPKGARVL